MSQLVVAFVAALVVFCVCDFVWLGLIAKNFYQGQIGGLLLDRPNWTAAALFYPLYAAGIVLFCVEPALVQGSWVRAFGTGLLLGLLCYATYDLSNLATLKGWTTNIVVVDVLWGTAVTAAAAGAGYFAARAA
jgi:uncharacterized membrane protein